MATRTRFDSTPLHSASTGLIAGPNAYPSPIQMPFHTTDPTVV
jgi:hypothetical protein